MPRKILYSPGFGAGWWTWNSEYPADFFCVYEPLVAAVEAGESLDVDSMRFTDDYNASLAKCHPALQSFVAELRKRFGDDKCPYLGGARDLAIYEAADGVKVRIEEYEGSESVRESYDDWF